jgi:hypothetical protein
MSTAPPGSTQSSTKKTGKPRKLFTLWVHDVHFSPVDLVINPDYFPPETKIGDIVEIYKQGNKEKALYLAIGAVTTIRGAFLPFMPLLLTKSVTNPLYLNFT